MSEQPARGSGQEPGDLPPGVREVRLRRSPRYRRFVLTGVLLGVAVAAVLAATSTPGEEFGRRAVFGFLLASCGLVGALLGGLAAVLAEAAAQRSSTRSSPARWKPTRGK